MKSRRKNDADKLAIGARLRRETTVTINAIAARVCLGTSKVANVKLHRHMREGRNPAEAKRAPLEGGHDREMDHAPNYWLTLFTLFRFSAHPVLELEARRRRRHVRP